LNEISNVVVEWGALNGDRDRDSDCIHYTHICMHCQNHGPWSMVHGPHSTLKFLTDASASSSDAFESGGDGDDGRWSCLEAIRSGSVNCIPIETKSFRLSLQVSLNVWVAYKENMGKELWRRTLWGGHWKKDGNSSK